MKFDKRVLLGLCLLGVVVVLLAVLSPLLFSDKAPLSVNPAGQDAQQWPLAAKGVVESVEDVEIASKVEGQLAEILVDEGDRVQVGQVLVRLDSHKIEANIAAAEAALRQAVAKRREAETGYRHEDIAAAKHTLERVTAISDEARRNYERQVRLLTQGAVTRVARDQAEESWQVAQAELNEARASLEKMQKGPRSEELAAARADEERARADLDYTRALANDFEMASPIDGMVIKRFRDAGETVEVGTPILTIVNPQKLRIWAEVEETDVGKVAVGQHVVVIVDAHPAQEFKGKVTKVYAAVQRKSQKTFDPVATFDINTQKILIALDDYNGLVHGMSATVRFLK